jgi:hypothetical protein
MSSVNLNPTSEEPGVAGLFILQRKTLQFLHCRAVSVLESYCTTFCFSNADFYPAYRMPKSDLNVLDAIQ